MPVTGGWQGAGNGVGVGVGVGRVVQQQPWLGPACEHLVYLIDRSVASDSSATPNRCASLAKPVDLAAGLSALTSNTML